MLWIVLGVVAAVLLVDVVLRFPVVRVATGFFEQMPEFNVRPAKPDPEVETVEFPSTDGVVLRGSVHRRTTDGPPAGVVVFAPELGGNQWMAPQYTEALLHAGFDVFAFDFRNQGESDAMPGYKPLHWLTQYEVDDLLAAVEHVRSREEWARVPLGLFGVSRGGGTALAAAALRPDVAGVWVDSGFSTDAMMVHYALRWAPLLVPEWVLRLLPKWHVRQTLVIIRWYSRLRTGRPYVRIERLLPRLRDKPVLLVAGQRDTYVPAVIGEHLCRHIDGRCELWVVKKAKHNGARAVATAEYDDRLRAIFAPADAEPAPQPDRITERTSHR